MSKVRIHKHRLIDKYAISKIILTGIMRLRISPLFNFNDANTGDQMFSASTNSLTNDSGFCFRAGLKLRRREEYEPLREHHCSEWRHSWTVKRVYCILSRPVMTLHISVFTTTTTTERITIMCLLYQHLFLSARLSECNEWRTAQRIFIKFDRTEFYFRLCREFTSLIQIWPQ